MLNLKRCKKAKASADCGRLLAEFFLFVVTIAIDTVLTKEKKTKTAMLIDPLSTSANGLDGMSLDTLSPVGLRCLSSPTHHEEVSNAVGEVLRCYDTHCAEQHSFVPKKKRPVVRAFVQRPRWRDR